MLKKKSMLFYSLLTVLKEYRVSKEAPFCVATVTEL